MDTVLVDEKAEAVKKLRKKTGMNRREFCEFFDIPCKCYYKNVGLVENKNVGFC